MAIKIEYLMYILIIGRYSFPLGKSAEVIILFWFPIKYIVIAW